MENREILKAKVQKEKVFKLNKRELIAESLSAIGFCILAMLLGNKIMLFDTYPLAFGLLAASTRQTPFVLIGIMASAFGGGADLMKLISAASIVALRIITRLYLDKSSVKVKSDGVGTNVFAALFSEHTYLRVMSGALGVFIIGVWRIIAGGFRFYDLFASIFYLVMTPVSAWLFSWYFNIREQKRTEKSQFSFTVTEERLYNVSCLCIACSLIYALDNSIFIGINVPVFIGVFLTLYACRRGVLYGIVAGLLLGVAYNPTYAPAFAFCAIAYASISKLSLFGGAIASCISGLIWTLYTGGFFALGSMFPSLFASSMIFCTAERINVFEDMESFFDGEEVREDDYSFNKIISEQKSNFQEEKIRSISESFSALSEIFYNLSSKLKRPTVLDLRAICEDSFENHCKECENRELCYGAEYDSTLEGMKKITVQLHSSGVADEKKLPDSFKRKCHNLQKICENINRSCAIATKKAFLNEKTEIFAFDYDAISKILNDAICENEEEFKIDNSMGKKIAHAIAEEGYGEHNVTVFGKRKLRIFARGLDLSDKNSDISSLKSKLEATACVCLTDPTFELAFGSVNMQIEARRTYSAEAAFATATSDGESICGDTVSVFENKNDYLYALISDGMGTGRSAALTSEMCNAFLRNMLTAGNRMETSLRMLNSVLRAKGSKSETECSATVDLLQLDLYSGALTLVKSGAAPTFVIRRGNVFKLASPSFPIGILRALDAKQMDIGCEDGDVIVMVSDGVMRGGEDCAYLTEMLREKDLVRENPSKIADRILRRAKAELDTPNDDISVIVVRVKKEICNW